jgi:hypothetical protein
MRGKDPAEEANGGALVPTIPLPVEQEQEP